MDMFSQVLRRNTVVALVAATFLSASLPAWAVVKKSQLITGTDGRPLAGQTIIITAPDGTTEEKETDKAGLLFWTADQDGNYILTPKAGGTPVTVNVTDAAGIPGGTRKLLYTTAAVAGVIGVAALLADDDDDDDHGGGSSGTDCTSTDIAGSADITSVSVIFNPGNHPPLFDGGMCSINDTSQTVVSVSCSGSGWNFSASNVAIQSGCAINTIGSGVYSGFNTTFGLNVSFAAGFATGTGTISAGNNGALPGGQPIRANIVLSRDPL